MHAHWPYEYSRDDTRRRIRVTAHRALTAADLTAIIDRQAMEETWSYGMLYDLRATSWATSRADALETGAHVHDCVERYGRRGPVAVVTRMHDQIAAAQVYAFRGARAGLVVEVFWDLQEAERWLDQYVSPD